MADLTFRISPNLIVGSYTTGRIGQFAADYGSKYMLVIDPVLKEMGTMEKVTQALTEHQLEFFIFDLLTETAETKTVKQALQLARQAHITGVLAVGGGKTLHVARSVAALFNEKRGVYDIIDGANTVTENPLPLICVLTTGRDSFIFTDQIPVIDSRSSRLVLLKAQRGLCKLTIFDPNLTITLSEKQLGSMTQEVCCLATEAYLSQKANFFSDMLAEKAVELLGCALDEKRTQFTTVPQEALLMQSGCLASLAVASSSIGVASLLSLCINARQHISRALITSVLFPYTIDDAAKYKPARLAKLLSIFRPEESDRTQEERAAAFAEAMRQRIAKLNLPARLKDLGVTIEQLTPAAEDAGQLDAVNSLARGMTSDDLFALIKAAY